MFSFSEERESLSIPGHDLWPIENQEMRIPGSQIFVGNQSNSATTLKCMRMSRRQKIFVACLILILFAFSLKQNASQIPPPKSEKEFGTQVFLNEKISEDEPEAAWRQRMSNLSIDNDFNLWNLNKTQKHHLLTIYAQYVDSQNSANASNKKYMNILSDKDADALEYLKQFQAKAQQIKWYERKMSDNQSLQYQSQFNKLLRDRQSHIKSLLTAFQDYEQDDSRVSPTRNITKSQFYQGIRFHQLTGHSLENQFYRNLAEEENQTLEQKYGLSNFSSQLRACVIVPTYQNLRNDRYLWNLESILQQEYSNYKVIIIDDASDDETISKIATHLLWRKADQSKYVLIRSRQRNKSLYSFYYGAHKYCDLGEVIYTIDGDDELVGRQVFKTVNAIYQSEQPYTLYSIFIVEHLRDLTLGNNHEYNAVIKQENSYRKDKTHGYSHLRTMLSDTFLLVDSASLKHSDNRFYQFITDNAVYYCAMELSCQKVRFLEQINYWYDYNTGNNIFQKTNYKSYRAMQANVAHQKSYRCLHDYLREALEWARSGE